jgi:transposase
MGEAKGRSRRRHAVQLKEQVLGECAEPGASVAAVALAHGLNSNLVHKWRRQANGHTQTGGVRAAPVAETFIPVAMVPSAPPIGGEIRLELRRGAIAVKVTWPREAAAECAGWLREILR